jgi:sugar transferase (PEP-CTERM system associated)
MVQIFSQYISRKAVVLIALEGCLIAAALTFGVKLCFWDDPASFEFYTMLPDFAIQALAVMLCIQVSFYYYELYDLHTSWRPSEQYIRLGQSLGGACVLLSFLYFLFPALTLGRGVFFLALSMVMSSVIVTRLLVDWFWRATVPGESVLILGTTKLAVDIAREIKQREDLNLRLVGFVQTEMRPDPNVQSSGLSGDPVLGHAGELEVIVQRHGVSSLIVVPDERNLLPVSELIHLRTRGVQVRDGHSTIASLTGRISLETVPTNWFIFSEGFRRTRSIAVFKRILDLAVSLAGLFLSAPIMALTALAVKLDSPGSVLFRQTRVGLAGRPFEVLKFRSMRADAEAVSGAQWAQKDDPRVTRIGKHLRKFRLDELPQFINVIRGDMSFVGPRPERPEFVTQLREQIPYYDERHTVRPGITGWAQVCYPYGASVEDALRKLEYDLFYLKGMSVFFDAAIVFKTVQIVLFGRGGR